MRPSDAIDSLLAGSYNPLDYYFFFLKVCNSRLVVFVLRLGLSGELLRKRCSYGGKVQRSERRTYIAKLARESVPSLISQGYINNLSTRENPSTESTPFLPPFRQSVVYHLLVFWHRDK